MNKRDCRKLLDETAKVLVGSDMLSQWSSMCPEDVVHYKLEGASESEILEAEDRLRIKFPSSYRTFLSVSNGWPEMGGGAPGALFPARKIQWLRDLDPIKIEAWADDELPEALPSSPADVDMEDYCYHEKYLENTLAISSDGDACILLLSPDDVDATGEWACWLLASWIPGMHRFSSFTEWMEYNYKFYSDSLCESARNLLVK